MSINRTQIVFEQYQKRKKNKVLSSNLTDPTPAGLRDECLKIYIDKGKPIDDPLIKSFFGSLGNEINYSNRIENFDIDKFKPVINFLEEKTTKPNIKIVDLVEWLIGLDEPVTRTETIKVSIPFWQIALACAIALLLAQGTYLLWNGYLNKVRAPKPDEHCMYWTGRHYEPINCKQQIIGVPIIPLDVEKLNSLKRITEQDTLTTNSLGKVWYTGRGNHHAFYTDSSFNPVDTAKRMLKLSNHILKSHTSNYRYLLNRFYWAIGLIFLTIGGFWLLPIIRLKMRK